MRIFNLIVVGLILLLLTITFSSIFRIAPTIPVGMVGIHNLTGQSITNIRVDRMVREMRNNQEVTVRRTVDDNFANNHLANKSYRAINSFVSENLLLTDTESRIYRKSGDFARNRMITVLRDSKLPAFLLVNNTGFPISALELNNRRIAPFDTLQVNRNTGIVTIFDPAADDIYDMLAIDSLGKRYVQTNLHIPDAMVLTFTVNDRLPVASIVNNTGVTNQPVWFRASGEPNWIRLTPNLAYPAGRFDYQIVNFSRDNRYDIRIGTTTNITTLPSFTKHGFLITRDQTLNFSSDDRDTQVILQNRTGLIVRELYIRPTGAPSWGNNRLTAQLPNNGNFTLTFNDPRTTQYDFRMVANRDIMGDIGWGQRGVVRVERVEHFRDNVAISGAEVTVTFTPESR